MALPIISAMGVETAVIPTAVLSTHTAFQGFCVRDLTEDIPSITEHWKKENIEFDAIYTGYLGSEKQLEIVSDIFDSFRRDHNLIFIDPVMGDHGKLYPGFTVDFAAKMAKLCSKADIIVPNLTEASFLLGVPYPGSDYDESEIKELLRKLSELGAKKVVLTGISFQESELGVMAYDAEKKEYFSYFNQKVPKSFHGTGDIFASCLVGALMNELSLEKALKLAVDFALLSIQETLKDEKHNWYGVNFESAIPDLVRCLRD